MIHLSKDDAWPKTWVKRDPFGPEEEVDKSFCDVFHEGLAAFMAKHEDRPTHVLLGLRELNNLRTDLLTHYLTRKLTKEGDDSYCGVIVIFSPRSGMEFLKG